MFWPPAFILLSAVAASLIDFNGFVAVVTSINNSMLNGLGWLFSLAAFAAVVLVAAIYASPLGRVRIGGATAKPILKRWNWFAITLCTTIATGILFWGTAEPMFYITAPPDFASVDGRSVEGARFALSTLYLHWTITPYAIYAVPALAFALAYYNLAGKYSLSAPFRLVFGKYAEGIAGDIIDALALFALVVGVAASLGAGVMTLSGGLEKVVGINNTVFVRLFMTVAIVLVYVASSLTGLQRGIKILSDLNVRIFILLCLFVFFAGPTLELLRLGGESLGVYARDFLPRSLGLGGRLNDPWTIDWTVFFFANWLAWAPITALFLGRIAVGYTVREFLIFNLVFPALFSAIWMTVFGGAALIIEAETGQSLSAALNANGPEAVIYALFDALPLTGIVVGVFVLATFVSFVTAMDSNTHSIAGVCLKSEAPAKGINDPSAKSDAINDKAKMGVKIFWGVLIGTVSWVMTATNGIDGIKILSNLGGAPGLMILIGCGIALLRMMRMAPEKLNDLS